MSEPDLTLLDGVAWQGSSRARRAAVATCSRPSRWRHRAASPAQTWSSRSGPTTSRPTPRRRCRCWSPGCVRRPDAETVSRVGTGYRLGLREDQVDVLRLQRLVADAEAARAAGDLDVTRLQARAAVAVSVATAAEDGPLLAVVDAARAQQARARRLLGTALLARGDAAEALPLLEATLAARPDDETRLAEVLRAEAQVRGVAAALARFARYAERVRDELGASPGEELAAAARRAAGPRGPGAPGPEVRRDAAGRP